MVSYQKTKGSLTVLKCVASVVFTCFLLDDLSCNDCGLSAGLEDWIMRWKSRGGGVNIDIVEISCQWVHKPHRHNKVSFVSWCSRDLNKWVKATSGPQSVWGLYYVFSVWAVSITRCVSSVNSKIQRLLCSTLKACFLFLFVFFPQVFINEPTINQSIWLDWR